MSYHNNNLNFYPAVSTPGEFDEFPFFNQPPVVNPLNHQAQYVPTDRWDVVPQLDATADSTTSFRGTAGSSEYHGTLFSNSYLTCRTSDSVVGTTPYDLGFDGYAQPSYTNPYWPTMSQQPHPGHHGLSNWGDFPSGSTLAPEASSMIPTFSSGKTPFRFATSRDQMLTDHEHSTTAPLLGGEPERPLGQHASPGKRSMRSLSVALLTSSLFKSRTCKL